MCPKIVEDETNEQPTGSTEKPNTSEGNSAPDNDILGITEEEETGETSEETQETTETEETQKTSEAQEQETEETEDVDSKDQEIENLRQQVIALQQGQQSETSEEAQESEESEESQEQTPQQISDSLVGDLSDEEFDKITGSKDEFANFLSKFGNNIIAKSKETTIKDIPDIVSKSFDRQSKMKSARDNFYQENPDLKKYSDYVGYMTNKLQSENPDKGIEELLSMTEKEVRKNLSLNKTAVETERERRNNENRRPVNPGSGRGASRQRTSDTRTDQQKQIDDILI